MDVKPPAKRAPVMVDVARLARVSHQTVSRVVNGSPRVRAETRERVLAAMRELDYRPNPLARALVTGRSNTLGVISFDTTLYGPASTLLGIERAAHEEGYAISIVSLASLDRPSALAAVERLRAQGVDGILVIAPQEIAADAVRGLPPEIPVVAVEAGPHDAVPVAAVNQVAGARAATEHLLELGHRTVWHIAGPADFLEAQARVEGWRSTLRAAGAPEPPMLQGDWSPRSGYELSEQLLAVPEATAVFVANDQMALGVLRRVYEMGERVPDRLSVVGFDDVPEAAYFTPPLTTVRQDFNEVGRGSLHLIVSEISTGVKSTTRVEVDPVLIVRASTGPA